LILANILKNGSRIFRAFEVTGGSLGIVPLKARNSFLISLVGSVSSSFMYFLQSSKELLKGNDQHHVALHDSMAELMRQYDGAISRFYPNREFFFPSKNGENYSRHWVTHVFQELWRKTNSTYAVPYDLRHHYAVTNINQWICEGFNFDDKLLYLSKSMGHYDVESTKYYYSLVPGLADILEDRTNVDFEDIVPEVRYEKI